MEQTNDTTEMKKPFFARYGFPIVLLLLCIALGAYLLWSRNAPEKLEVLGDAPAFSLQDTDGQTVTLESTNGKVRLVYFFFANCPDVCPPTSFVLSQVQDELKNEGVFGSETQILSITIDPERDSPESLRSFAAKFNADPAGWKFLRTDPETTAKLAEDFKMPFKKADDENFLHYNLIALVDQQGQIRKFISANDFILNGEDNLQPSEIVKDVKSLL